MGCDIHLYVEVRDKEKRWHALLMPDQIYSIVTFDERELDDAKEKSIQRAIQLAEELPVQVPYDINLFFKGDKFDHDKWWEERWGAGDNRNPDCFAILGGKQVRGVPYRSILEARGVPPDASEFCRTEVKKWKEEGHHHSHMTLRELLAFPWEDLSQGRLGWLDSRTYWDWWTEKGRQGAPDNWCEKVGSDIEMVEPKEMELRLVNDHALDECYTMVRWTSTYAEIAGDFYSKFLPALQTLQLSPEEVRVVFFFDSL